MLSDECQEEQEESEGGRRASLHAPVADGQAEGMTSEQKPDGGRTGFQTHQGVEGFIQGTWTWTSKDLEGTEHRSTLFPFLWLM